MCVLGARRQVCQEPKIAPVVRRVVRDPVAAVVRRSLGVEWRLGVAGGLASCEGTDVIDIGIRVQSGGI